MLEELCDCSMNCRENPNSGLGSKILKLIVACREAKETLQVEVSQVNFLKNLMASARHCCWAYNSEIGYGNCEMIIVDKQFSWFL